MTCKKSVSGKVYIYVELEIQNTLKRKLKLITNLKLNTIVVRTKNIPIKDNIFKSKLSSKLYTTANV